MDISRKTPEWLWHAYEFLADKTGGPAWDHYMTAWFTFEGTFSIDDITSVSTIVTNHI